MRLCVLRTLLFLLFFIEFFMNVKVNVITTLSKINEKGNFSRWVFTERPLGLGYKAVNGFGKTFEFDSLKEVDKSIEWFLAQGYTDEAVRPVPATPKQEAEVVNTSPVF